MLEMLRVRNTTELQEAYDNIYRGPGILHSESFYRWILDLLQPRAGYRLLDVACGQGRLVQLARARGLDAVGIDLSWAAVVKGVTDPARVMVADGQRLPFCDQSFDYITCIGSLEHYVDVATGVAEMARLLTPQGKACILLPNLFSVFGNILHAWHTGCMVDDGQPIQRFATRCEWQNVLHANGLRVIATYKYECEPPRTWRDAVEYFRHPKRLIRLLFTPILPINLANSFVFVCTRVPSPVSRLQK